MGGSIKGISVEISGSTTKLQSALADVNTQSKNLQSELKSVNSLLKLDPTNTELLRQKQELLTSSISKTCEKLEILKNTQSQVNQQFQNGEISTEQYRAFSREIESTEIQLEKLKTQAKSAGDNFDYLGTKADKINGFMKNAAIGVAGVAAGLAGMAVKAAQSADDINTLSKQTGLSTEEIQKFQYASDIIDVSLDTLTGSMAKLTKNMSSAKDGTGTAAKAFKTLGVSITDSSGKLKNNQDVFNSTITALGNVANETERDALAMSIFGKSAQDLNPLILGGADALTQLGQQAEDAGLILSQEALDGANQLTDGLDTLKATGTSAISLIGGEVSKTLLPQLQKLVEKIPEIINLILSNKDSIIVALAAISAGLAAFNITVMIQKAVQAFQKWQVATEGLTVAQRVLNLVMAANPIALIVTIIASLVAAIVVLWNTNEGFRTAVINIWETIKSKISVIVAVIANFFTVTIPNAINIMVTYFSGLPTKIAGFFTQIYNNFRTWASSVGAWIATAIPSLLNSIVTFFNELPANIGYALGYVVAKLISFGAEALEWVTTNVPIIIDNIITFFSKLPDEIWTALVNIVTKFIAWREQLNTWINVKISELIQIIVNFFLGLPNQIATALSGCLDSIVNWCDNLKSTAKKQVPLVIESIVGFFSELPSKMLDIGVNIVSGLWEGISSMVGWLGDKISSFVDGIVSGFTEGLDIHSPSGVMADKAQWIPAGIAKGITDNAKLVTSAMNAINYQISGSGSTTTTTKYTSTSTSTPITLNITQGDIVVQGNADAKILAAIKQCQKDAVNEVERQLKQLVLNAYQRAYQYGKVH